MNELKGYWDHSTKPSQFCVKKGKEEIYRGGYNQGYEILMKRKTPETNDLARGNHVVPTEWAEQLERERDEALRERNEALNAIHTYKCEVEAWELLREARRERDEARDQNAKLRDIAERAINDFNGCKAKQLRAELDQLKEGGE